MNQQRLTGLEDGGIDFDLSLCGRLEDRELRLVQVGAGGGPRVGHAPLLGFLLLIHSHQLKEEKEKTKSQAGYLLSSFYSFHPI